MSKVWKFFGLIAGTILLLLLSKWSGFLVFHPRQMASIGIFSMFIYGTLLFGEFRLAFAFGGIFLLMACKLLTVEQFVQSASLDVLVFLIGTFLVIGFLEESEFFEHVVGGIVTAIGPRPQRLLAVLMLIGSIASALVGEVTAILFMAGAMLHLTGKYRLNPIPFVIMLVFACNTGSAMSSVGNPIGVLIALHSAGQDGRGLTFIDFCKCAAPVAIVVDVVTYAICRWWFADAFAGFAEAVRREFAERAASVARAARIGTSAKRGSSAGGDPGDWRAADGVTAAVAQPAVLEEDLPDEGTFVPDEESKDDSREARNAYRLCWVILIALVLLLATHGLTERLLGLKEGTMMVGAALVMGSVVLLLRREKARELVERRVDWWTLSFFMMLFASVGTLQEQGVTRVIAERLSGMGGGHFMVIQIVGWATGWLSAFLDNVLAVATFMPVVHDIRVKAGGPYSSSIYWFMLFGGTFMGNMTIIGSTANIVAVGLLEKRGHGTIAFGYWMKIGFIISIASMLVAAVMLTSIEHAFPHLMPMLNPPGPGT